MMFDVAGRSHVTIKNQIIQIVTVCMMFDVAGRSHVTIKNQIIQIVTVCKRGT